MIICKILDTCPEAACHYSKDNIKEKQRLETEMESNRVTTVLQNRAAPETVTGGTEGNTTEGKSGPNAYVGSKSSCHCAD